MFRVGLVMGIVSFGVSSSSPTSPQGLESRVLVYAWNSRLGYQVKKDAIAFPLLAVITKIASNFPVRVRLYRTFEQRDIDTDRPPWVLAKQNQPQLDVLVGQGTNSIILNPTPLIAGVTEAPATIEKLLPDAVTINLLIYLVA